MTGPADGSDPGDGKRPGPVKRSESESGPGSGAASGASMRADVVAEGQGVDGGGDSVAERGETTIADRVVAKVAGRAAHEALRTGPDARKLPRGKRSAPRATVDVRESSARVKVSVELGYPSDIGAQCSAVRRQVASRVRELVGMEVPDVAVEVERLHSPHLDGETLGRVR